ncbi:MAG: hypothetical protein H7A51_15065 [Akkermansiaceae bacterium]|nr:hypothetical protein [Akkermansiaceae bacterium]
MLDLSKLPNVQQRGGKTIAACPACRAAGGDKQGNHLVIYDNGKFGCAAHDGDSAHRKEIFALAGILEKQELTPEAKRQWAEQRRREKLRITKQEKLTERIQEILEGKLSPYLSNDWQADLWHASPIRFDHSEAAPHDFIASLFKPDDVLWLGDTYDTGKPEHAANFKTCRDWLTIARLPHRIAAGTFHPGTISRCKEYVKSSPFILLESDELIGRKPSTPEERERNKALSSALIGYAKDKLGLTLRAVIDTGNRSLHAWYDRPPEPAMNAIHKMAAGLRIDKAVLDSCQAAPLRMPHCIHEKTNHPARLLYLNPITQ